MPWSVLVPLTVSVAALGSVFGAVEVATVALADDAGHKVLSGVMLAVFALASGIAGVVTGAVTFRRSATQRARIGLMMLAAGALTLPLLPGLVAVSIGLFVTGLALAPTLIAMFSIIESVSPRSRLNEAISLFVAGMSAGIAPGAWIAGVVADEAGGAASYWVASVSAVARGMLVAHRLETGSALTGRPTWTNWARNQTSRPAQEMSPHDAHEVVDAVRRRPTPAPAGQDARHRPLLHRHRADRRPAAAPRPAAGHRRRRPGRDDRHRPGRHAASRAQRPSDPARACRCTTWATSRSRPWPAPSRPAPTARVAPSPR